MQLAGPFYPAKLCESLRHDKVQFENPNAFHLHELNGPAMRSYAQHRLSVEMDMRLREFAKQSNCDLSIVYRHAVFEYLKAHGVDCLKPLGCL